MISLDTSVIVRYLVGVPEDQAARALSLVERAEGVALSVVALVECAHVLRTQYAAETAEIIDAILDLIRRENVHVIEIDTTDVADALIRARSMPGRPIPDALIAVQAQRARALPLATFDRDMRRYGVAVLEP